MCSGVLGFFSVLLGVWCWHSSSGSLQGVLKNKALNRSLVLRVGLVGMGIFFRPSLFPWNSWIPISREFSIANFKSYGDYRSLDSSIAWFVDRLIRSLDSSIANIRIPSIATIQILSITRIKDSVDHEDKNSPKIEIPTIAKYHNIPSIARNSKISVDFSFEKQIYICSYLVKKISKMSLA